MAHRSAFPLLLALLTGAAFAAIDSVGIPIAKIGPSTVCCPEDSVLIDGWASIDPDGEVVEWQWDIGGDGKPDRITDRGDLVHVAPLDARTYRVILRVKDNKGNLSAPDTAVICVMNALPQVSMPRDSTVRLGTRIAFSPAVKHTCGSIARYEWDFDNDGVYEYSSRVNGNTSRAFYRPGRYLAKFRVVDSFGKQGGGVVIVTVAPAGGT